MARAGFNPMPTHGRLGPTTPQQAPDSSLWSRIGPIGLGRHPLAWALDSYGPFCYLGLAGDRFRGWSTLGLGLVEGRFGVGMRWV